jgi:ferric-dicitrate binding protein FerR (iron transport regulator)
MTISTFAYASGTRDATTAYRPGACNIGPAEIARRRMAGHVGLIATLVLLAALIATDAPPAFRLFAILPAAASASGYLQAWLKFCAGFGSRGIFNFGAVGESTTVADHEARAKDRRRSRQISLWALAIGAGVGISAVFLPV